MKSVFTILEGAGKGTSKPLTSALMIVGRSKNADIQVDDPLVSRRHLEIRVESDAVFVENKSAQGSVLNGKPLTGTVSLNPGDILEVGSTKMRFEEAPASSAPEKWAAVQEMEAEMDGTRLASPEDVAAMQRKEDKGDETRAMVEDGTRMLNPNELPNWVGQEKIEKKVAARSGFPKIAIAVIALVLLAGVAVWYFASHKSTAGDTLTYKDGLYDFSIDRPLDWSKTADENGVMGFGAGSDSGNNWSRVNIYTDKNPDFATTGLTDGFSHYQDILKKRYAGAELQGSRKIQLNGATVIFYSFSASSLDGIGIYLLNDNTRIVVECTGARGVYDQNSTQYRAILKSFQLDEYVSQQYIDFPLPDEAMQQLALSNPSGLSSQVDSDISSGKNLFNSSDVSPDNLYKAIQQFRAAAQLCLAPPQRLPAYNTAAEGLAEATRKFNHELEEQRFQVTSALKEGDKRRAYWEANKMMQMVPDKTDPAYQEAYEILQTLPVPKS
ncbi:MAG TPA: FHA domain-containing protein [Pseudomonadales bacterium]|nr:FHA domain-containing protein [Pseudomonadales bacterium]